MAYKKSHLLQMRGLKPCFLDLKIATIGSHLLQMRGLKLNRESYRTRRQESHLLQMRGLKPQAAKRRIMQARRIFYRCVD